VSKRIEVEEGSGNVFADIGLPNPEDRLAKADLAIHIAETIRTRRLTQTRAGPLKLAPAHILKIDQPEISCLLRSQLSGFSTERLMHFLTLLGRDVEITAKPVPRSRRKGTSSCGDSRWQCDFFSSRSTASPRFRRVTPIPRFLFVAAPASAVRLGARSVERLKRTSRAPDDYTAITKHSSKYRFVDAAGGSVIFLAFCFL
jgi:predicted XRE-type DNA-binding protein